LGDIPKQRFAEYAAGNLLYKDLVPHVNDMNFAISGTYRFALEETDFEEDSLNAIYGYLGGNNDER